MSPTRPHHPCYNHPCPNLAPPGQALCITCTTQAPRRRLPKTSARGYGAQHQAARAAIAAKVASGTVICHRCHDRIHAGEPWELDHRDDGLGSSPSHTRCNRSAGGQRGAQRRWQRP